MDKVDCKFNCDVDDKFVVKSRQVLRLVSVLLCMIMGLFVVLAVTGCGSMPEADGTGSGEAVGIDGASSGLSGEPSASDSQSEADAEEMRLTEAYGSVLDSAYWLVAGVGSDVLDIDYLEGLTGLDEFVHITEFENTDERFACVGYRFEDLNGDGISELLIMEAAEGSGMNDADGASEPSGTSDGSGAGFAGSNQSDDIPIPNAPQNASGSRLFAVYTLVDGKPYCVLESMYRNSYSLTEDGTFFNKGSAGAMYSIFAEEKLSKDGTTMSCIDYWFTYEKDESFQEIGYYHNTTGDWDKNLSEEVGEEEYYKALEKLESKVQALEMKTFAEYAPQ